MNPQQQDQLVASALEVRQRAYAPHSGFSVGAALLTADGNVIVGCNVENDSYGLTICAERVAVASAVAAGQRQFSALAVACRGAVSPCGACREVLAQFCDDLLILLVDADHDHRIQPVQLKDLLPERFRLPRNG